MSTPYNKPLVHSAAFHFRRFGDCYSAALQDKSNHRRWQRVVPAPNSPSCRGSHQILSALSISTTPSCGTWYCRQGKGIYFLFHVPSVLLQLLLLLLSLSLSSLVCSKSICDSSRLPSFVLDCQHHFHVVSLATSTLTPGNQGCRDHEQEWISRPFREGSGEEWLATLAGRFEEG
jgi:hypothetical protein